MWGRSLSCLARAAVFVLLAACCSRAHAQHRVVHASASDVQIHQGSTLIQHLELGDWYEVTVDRGLAHEQYHGTLVKVTDRWLVLFTNSEGRSERGVPIASHVPYVGRLFRNVGIGRTTEYRWIPREAATIRGRTLADKKTSWPTPKADMPPSESPMTVEIARQGEVDETEGKVSLNNDKLTLHYQELETVVKRTPVLGKIPLVGGAFSKEIEVSRDRTCDISLSDVLCIVDESAASDYEELQPAR